MGIICISYVPLWVSHFMHTDLPVILTPEQQRSFNELTSNFERFQQVCITSRPKVNMFETGFMAYSLKPFTNENLPIDAGWIWNQSSARVSVTLPKEIITLQKMSPRRRRDCTKAPSYKIWTYCVQRRGSAPVYFIWCEKGLPSSRTFGSEPKPSCTLGKLSGIASGIGTIFPDELTVGDLAFLGPFCDQSTALELGWVAESA